MYRVFIRAVLEMGMSCRLSRTVLVNTLPAEVTGKTDRTGVEWSHRQVRTELWFAKYNRAVQLDCMELGSSIG